MNKQLFSILVLVVFLWAGASAQVGRALRKGKPETRISDLVQKIVEVSGVPANFAVYESDVDNAEARIEKGERQIFYNAKFLASEGIDSKDNWNAIFVLAHEIGHHLLGHTFISSREKLVDDELNADRFAAGVLARMGADREDAVGALKFSPATVARIGISITDRENAVKGHFDKMKAIMTKSRLAKVSQSITLANFKTADAVKIKPHGWWYEIYSAELRLDGSFDADLRIESTEALAGFSGQFKFEVFDTTGSIIHTISSNLFTVGGTFGGNPESHDNFTTTVSREILDRVASIKGQFQVRQKKQPTIDLPDLP